MLKKQSLVISPQQLESDFSPFQTLYSKTDLNSIPDVSYAQIQPRLDQAIQRFLILPQSDILMISTPDLSFYREMIKDWIVHTNRDLCVNSAENPSKDELLGYIFKNDKNELEVHKGLLHQCNNGVIILSLRFLLNNPWAWQAIRQIQVEHKLSSEWDKKLELYGKKPQATPLHLKLILTGDRELFAALEESEPSLFYGLALYAEYESDFQLNTDNFLQWVGFVRFLCAQFSLKKPVDFNTYIDIARLSSRYMEEQFRVSLSPIWYQNLLTEAQVETQLLGKTNLDSQAIHLAVTHKEERENYLLLRSREDIQDGQVIIHSHGEAIGQVNGLTVVTIAGYPKSYGEPSRISCVVHVGDGDLSDIERKAELGGNIHAKGMMIMQAFVCSALDLDHPLPFSASIAFEQSYCEVDGDSASLAELCAFVSSLSQTPINQQIAITGAVDQFGLVQAVGGINEKIEGFFDICKQHKLTGNQGVILPKTNLTNLCLNQEVVQAVKNKEFHIWAVENVDEALFLLTGIPFYETEGQPLSLIEKILSRIYALDHQGSWITSWLERLFK